MFDSYLRKILPIPLTEIKASVDGYKYLITTYSSVISESGTRERIWKRIRLNKRIKSISDWVFKKDDYDYKQAIVEFIK